MLTNRSGINNALTVIMLNADLMLTKGEYDRDACEVIKESAVKISRIVENKTLEPYRGVRFNKTGLIIP